MKTLVNFKRYIWVAVCVLLIASCEKHEVDADITNTMEEDGFNSTTGNSDVVIEESNLDIATPLLHMHFDDNVSETEAFAKFDKKVSEYLNTYEHLNKGVSTEWFYRVSTYTGTQTGNNTNGNVRANVRFMTDKGGKTTSIRLDHPGLYNDHEGGWDVYLFRTYIHKKAVSWVKAQRASIRLQGTDHWLLNYFIIEVLPNDQKISSKGGSFVKSEPNRWFCSSTRTGWDRYYTGNIGFGRLKF